MWNKVSGHLSVPRFAKKFLQDLKVWLFKSSSLLKPLYIFSGFFISFLMPSDLLVRGNPAILID